MVETSCLQGKPTFSKILKKLICQYRYENDFDLADSLKGSQGILRIPGHPLRITALEKPSVDAFTWQLLLTATLPCPVPAFPVSLAGLLASTHPETQQGPL